MSAAYYINVAEWTAENVAEWLGGLDDAIFPYAHFFINNQIDGRHLLTLLPDDLKNLNISKIGHQEIILDAVDLLRQLHYTLSTETLQSIALRVGCKARSLYNDLKRNGPKELLENEKQERISVSILSAVSDILMAVKTFVSWLDRYPFEGEKRYAPIRKTVLRLSIELASTAQRDQFAEKPHDIIKSCVFDLAELCDRVIQEFNDSLIIQPASLDIVTVKKKTEEEWGLNIDSSYNGVLVVGNVKYQSPAHRSGKVEIGDEIIQVNYQTVVGWQLKKLVYAMCEHSSEVHLTLKKRPRHANLLGQVIIMKPYLIPSRKAVLTRHHKWSDSNISLHIQEGIPTIHRAPIAMDEVDDEDDSAFLPDGQNGSTNGTPGSKNVPPTPYQMFPAKPRATVQRRATVSGASPTVTRAPVALEDLVTVTTSPLQKELVSRSISHDPTKHIAKHALEAAFLSRLKPIQAEDMEDSLSSSKPEISNNTGLTINIVPCGNDLSSLTPTTINTLSSGLSASGSDADSGIVDEKSWSPVKSFVKTPCDAKSVREVETIKILSPEDQLRKMVELISSPKTEPPLILPSSNFNYNVRKNSSSNSIASTNSSDANFKEKEKRIQEENAKFESRASESPKTSWSRKSPIHILDKKANKLLQSPLARRKNHGRHASRRVSCKDLGQGDCQGWLYKRKDGKRLFSGPKWTKRWVVLKKQYLYCYRDKEDVKAECLLFLPGFAVSPATECKAKKYAFKLHTPMTLFLFASESLVDMTKWMNKMGLAAISYPSLGTQKSEMPDVYYSETEDECEEIPLPNSPKHSSPPVADSMTFLSSHRSSDSESKLSLALDATYRTQRQPPDGNRSTSTSSVSSVESNRHIVTSPTSAVTKFAYTKPLVPSPKKTVAEKPLERSNPEPLKNSSKSTSPSHRSTRYSGNFNEDLRDVNSPFSYEVGSLERTRGTLPNSPLSYDSSSSENPSSQPPLHQRSPVPTPRYPVRQNPVTTRPARPQQFHPNRAPNVPSSAAKTNMRFNQTATNILRSSSLQKLNSGSDSWSPNDSSTGQNQLTEFVSVLDREYHKAYGQKKPETISPKSLSNDNTPQTSPEKTWWNGSNSMVRSATSRQIHSLYTRDSWKGNENEDCENSRTASTSSEGPHSALDSPSLPPLPEKNLKYAVSGVNSVGRGNKKETSPAPRVAPPPPPKSEPNKILNISSPITRNPASFSQPEPPPKPSKFSISKQFSPKSPSTSFRFFSSPKFVRKFTSPKLDRKQLPPPSVPSGTQTNFTGTSGNIVTTKKCDLEDSPSSNPSPQGLKPQKTERTFLGSPKLARAFFGSPKQTRKVVNTATTAVQTEHTFDELVRIHQQRSTVEVPSSSTFTPIDDLPEQIANLDLSADKTKGSNSSLNSSTGSGSGLSSGSSMFYVETRIRPQITISLPLVTESSTDNRPETPDTPRTPVIKPTMGISMIGKKRSPSASSDIADKSHPSPIEGEIMEEDFSEDEVPIKRSEITVMLNCQEKTHGDDGGSRDPVDGIEALLNTLKSAGVTPDGIDLEERRKRTMTQPSLDNTELNKMILDVRALQRTLKDHQLEASAIEELFSRPVTSQSLQDWICRYNHLLPPDYC